MLFLLYDILVQLSSSAACTHRMYAIVMAKRLKRCANRFKHGKQVAAQVESVSPGRQAATDRRHAAFSYVSAQFQLLGAALLSHAAASGIVMAVSVRFQPPDTCATGRGVLFSHSASVAVVE